MTTGKPKEDNMTDCNTNCPLEGQFFRDWKQNITDTLRRIEDKVDTKLSQHDKRIGRLERWFWRVSGGITLLIFILKYGESIKTFFSG